MTDQAQPTSLFNLDSFTDESKRKSLTEIPTAAQVHNLPLFTGKPDSAPWRDDLPTTRQDWRERIKKHE